MHCLIQVDVSPLAGLHDTGPQGTMRLVELLGDMSCTARRHSILLPELIEQEEEGDDDRTNDDDHDDVETPLTVTWLQYSSLHHDWPALHSLIDIMGASGWLQPMAVAVFGCSSVG